MQDLTPEPKPGCQGKVIVPLLTTVTVPATSVLSPPAAACAFGLLAGSTTDAVLDAEVPRSRLPVPDVVLPLLLWKRKMPSMPAPETVLPSILNTPVPRVTWALMPFSLLFATVWVTVLLVMMAVKFGLDPLSGVRSCV